MELRDVGVPQGLLRGDALGRVELQQLGQQVRGRRASRGEEAVQVAALAAGQALQHLLRKGRADGLHVLLRWPPCKAGTHLGPTRPSRASLQSPIDCQQCRWMYSCSEGQVVALNGVRCADRLLSATQTKRSFDEITHRRPSFWT